MFAAKLGESYHFGLKPLKENDPDKMRAAFEKGIAELLNYGSLPEVWQRAVQTGTGGDGVGDFERPYVESTRDERQSAVPLGGFAVLEGERHPSTSLENNDAPESAAARFGRASGRASGGWKAPKSTSAAGGGEEGAPKSTSARAAAEKTSQLEVLLFVSFASHRIRRSSAPKRA